MESEPVDALPAGKGWHYEPKWDGFRCIAHKDSGAVDLRSRNAKPLARFFPEVAAAIAALPVARVVLDGELVIAGAPFDALQLRLHPAASRVALLAKEQPATFIAFDLLAEDGASLLARPFAERRKALVALFKRIGKQQGRAPGARACVMLSRATTARAAALKWTKSLGQGLDGIVAKRLELAYQPGRRAMLKWKLWRTVDCVVGGLYLRPGTTNTIEYLLLGLYDDDGKLNFVGRARVDDEAQAHAKLAPIVGGPGFTGTAPAGVNRWSGRERQVIPVKPRYVVEVSADHIEAGRFRHGSRLLRWRDDKRPEQCGMEQIEGGGAGR
jgi:ATP-dependent DNA ligase